MEGLIKGFIIKLITTNQPKIYLTYYYLALYRTNKSENNSHHRNDQNDCFIIFQNVF